MIDVIWRIAYVILSTILLISVPAAIFFAPELAALCDVLEHPEKEGRDGH